MAMAMAVASGAARSRPGSVSLTSAAAAPHHGGGPQLWRLSRGLRRGWRRRKRKPTNSPNGRQLGQAGGGAAGRAGASLRDLIQRRALRTVPAPSRGPRGWPGPRSRLPQAVGTPQVRRARLPGGAGAGSEEGAKALDASPGRSEWPRGLGEAAGAVGPDERVWEPAAPHPGPESEAPGAAVRAAGATRRPPRWGRRGS